MDVKSGRADFEKPGALSEPMPDADSDAAQIGRVAGWHRFAARRKPHPCSLAFTSSLNGLTHGQHFACVDGTLAHPHAVTPAPPLHRPLSSVSRQARHWPPKPFPCQTARSGGPMHPWVLYGPAPDHPQDRVHLSTVCWVANHAAESQLLHTGSLFGRWLYGRTERHSRSRACHNWDA
jgi:hypothetical protein